MDVRFINPVLESMISTMETMAQLGLHPEKPKIKTNATALGAVTSMMRMSGPTIQGSIALSFSTSLIIELVKRTLRESITGINDVARDLAGELSNIVTGGAKTKLQNSGFDISMALPQILDGVDHLINHEINAPVIVLPINTDAGKLFVELCFNS